MQYNPQKIEKKWQRTWESKKKWKISLSGAKKPYYNLMMFPYPSAEGLHVGNVYAFTGSDIHGRFKRMQGYDVFEPMGFDAFGIHSENFAIKQGIHPRILIKQNINNFRKQLKRMGGLFAWDNEIDTTTPEYYKWTQWLFLQLYKEKLAYRAKAPVDWCPSCKTVLANEQVIHGRCERCDTEVIQKEMEQWFFRITKYADKLLKNLDSIDWSERTKLAQKNWIGKSEGALLQFPINSTTHKIEVFTTRPDTLFGATYLVLSPEHSLIEKLSEKITNEKEVTDYIKKAQKKNELERTELSQEKTGVELKGIKARNPVTKEDIPVFIADYVIVSYGTGAIMAVPAHDERDMEFAEKYGLEVRVVIAPRDAMAQQQRKAYMGEGLLVNSEKFDGMTTEKARSEITKFAKGKKKSTYHLRDWLISRQRYWGAPIPIIYCEACGVVPVPEKDLPVKLPYVEDFRPAGKGVSPLASVPSFVNTKCPTCKGKAKRETDVSDTFLDSAWYFLRYPSTDITNKPFDKKLTKKWLPVDMYIGGQEHAVLHLLYTRFTTMVLKKLGYIDFEEPFNKFRAHGLLTKDGSKMSKSRGNVVNPDEYFVKYGADTVRMYLMFLGPLSEAGGWSDQGIVGIWRFLNRFWVYTEKLPKKNTTEKDELIPLRHKTIKKVTEDLEGLRYNTAIAIMMEYFNAITKSSTVAKKDISTLLILLSPFAPYITEELWKRMGNTGSVHSQQWPKYDASLIKDAQSRLVLQVNGRVRDIIEVSSDISEEEAKELTLASSKIQKWIGGKKPKRVVVVLGRLVNVVT